MTDDAHEVTPEMVDAGLNALIDYGNDENDANLVKEVFLAMLLARDERSLIERSGIPLDALNEAAALVYEWDQSEEYDARALVIRIVETVCRAREADLVRFVEAASRTSVRNLVGVGQAPFEIVLPVSRKPDEPNP